MRLNLKAQSTDELARLQTLSKIYFAPPKEILILLQVDEGYCRAERMGKKVGIFKGQCIVHGPMRLGSGELSPPQINIVNITSLGKRLK